MSKKKEARNEELVLKRKEDPATYSFRELGRFFNIKESTAFDIWMRYKDKYPKKKSR